MFAKLFKKRRDDKQIVSSEEFPFEDVVNCCTNMSTTRKFVSADGSYEIIFTGIIYEPIYEFFERKCCIYGIENGVGFILYHIGAKNISSCQNKVIELGSYENALNWINKRNCLFEEIDLQKSFLDENADKRKAVYSQIENIVAKGLMEIITPSFSTEREKALYYEKETGRKQYFFDDDGNEYWYSEDDEEKYYTKYYGYRYGRRRNMGRWSCIWILY